MASPSSLRRAVGWSYAGAMLWAAGNSLTSGMLVNYLALDLGATGLEVGWLYAAPALFGLLRLATPALSRRLGGSKRTCLAASLGAYLLLALLPAAVVRRPTFGLGLSPAWLLVALVCLHQLLEQFGTVALFTWLGELIPRRLRGPYFARRNLLQLALTIVALPAGGYLTDQLGGRDPATVVRAYAVVIGGGAALLLVSLAPLMRMPARVRGVRRGNLTAGDDPPSSTAPLWRDLVEPWTRRDARRLLIYGLWFSFFNGLTAVAQNVYPKNVLKLSLVDVQWMQTTMRVGQMGVGLWAGAEGTRSGFRRVLLVCQVVVGAGPLFYLIASPERPYLAYGAWLCWSAYAGINLALPILSMQFASAGRHGPNLAAYYAWTSLANMLGNVGGGYLFDRLAGWTFALGPWSVDRYQAAFLLAAATRTAGVVWIARLDASRPSGRE